MQLSFAFNDVVILVESKKEEVEIGWYLKATNNHNNSLELSQSQSKKVPS